MASYQLIIAPAAKADLKNIYHYGVCQWGKARSDSYLEAVKDRLWSLTEQPLIGIERAELLVGIRSLSIESHILFYRVTTSNVEIIRVLHRRQDPARHLE